MDKLRRIMNYLENRTEYDPLRKDLKEWTGTLLIRVLMKMEI
jgi:hypothetical protein